MIHAARLAIATILLNIAAYAGGPAYVAGRSGFNPGLAGTPVRWAGTEIVYYTDLGNLSPLESQNSANLLVADAFLRWTGVSTAALKAMRGGPLDEDVSGANVTISGSALTMPADIQPDSTKAMAFVYDADGKVTDALLGAGASQSCTSNMVFGGADKFTPDGHIAHALIVLNGTCIKVSSDIPILRYRLIRVIGRALGLDWSQANDTVETNRPTSPSADEVAGYPLMHPMGSLCWAPYGCYTNADQLRMDDRMTISALYPVTADNIGIFIGSFPAKKIFAATTARIRGSVLFGQTAIQGAHVVARLVDPTTNAVSVKTVATSVSGFLYHGNAGNVVTGYVDASGQRYECWGSDDPALRGYFELAGLEIPTGSTSAKYQISIEPANPNYTGALSVGPYKSGQVEPPGTASPIVVTVSAGSDVTQDIVLSGPRLDGYDMYEPHSFEAPSPIPGGGNWAAVLNGAGDVDWHALTVRADRTFSVETTAMGNATPSATKALPVLGIWNAADDATTAPVVAQTYFNAGKTGITRLQASVGAGAYKLAITDARGDGRPDFLYRARVLYADTVSPPHASPEGGTVLTIDGLGFNADLKVKVGAADAPVLSFAPERLMVAAPSLPDGTYALTIEDPVTGGTALIANAIRYGGASDDTLQLLNGSNPSVPLGTQAPNPFRVRVLAKDGVTTVSGASVRFVSPSGSVLLAPCNTQDCTIATDGVGEASVWMSVTAAGATTLTATLSSGASVSATVSGISSALAVVAAPPKLYIAKNTAASVPLLARVVSNGATLAGRLAQFEVMLGSGTLSSASVMTDANGEATSTLTIASMTSEIRVSTCIGVAPQMACDIFYIYPVAATGGMRLIKSGGDGQYVVPGRLFLPVSVRASDLSDPPNVVAGVPVKFSMVAYKPAQSDRTVSGEVVTGHYGEPVVVASEAVTVNTNGWGLASYVPRVTGSGLTIEIRASNGGSDVTFTLHTWETGSPATMLERSVRGTREQ
jgi:hypothetical protein